MHNPVYGISVSVCGISSVNVSYNVNVCVPQASTMKGYSEFLGHKERLISSEMHLREVNELLKVDHISVLDLTGLTSIKTFHV